MAAGLPRPEDELFMIQVIENLAQSAAAIPLWILELFGEIVIAQ